MTVFLDRVVMSMASGREGGWWVLSILATSLRGRTTHIIPAICSTQCSHFTAYSNLEMVYRNGVEFS